MSLPIQSPRRDPAPSYTLLVIPPRSAAIRRLHLSHRLLRNLAWLLGVSLLLGGSAVAHYTWVVLQARENPALKDANIELKSRLESLQQEMTLMQHNVQHMEQFAQRLRSITQLNDPSRWPSLQQDAAPPSTPRHATKVLYAAGERTDHEDESMDSAVAQSILQASQAAPPLAPDSLPQLASHLAGHTAWLASLPSICPLASATNEVAGEVAGEARLLTWSFGQRLDPYTGQTVLHKGVDFATVEGASVVAPGDGTVVFVGDKGLGYGQVIVLDHGYGYQTHFAHLATPHVHVAQQVQRGQRIATVGRSGRTTGAHLHYEVRLQGVPQDPELFVFD